MMYDERTLRLAAYMQNDGPPPERYQAATRWALTGYPQPETVEVFKRDPEALDPNVGESLLFCQFRDLERLAPYETRVRRGWGVRW